MPHRKKHRTNKCKPCLRKYTTQWVKNNPEKMAILVERQERKNGVKPMSENKECSAYLGIYVAERVLANVFKNVEVMPYSNPGFDFICNRGKKIDVKSACTVHGVGNRSSCWNFHIDKNKTPDYFLCLAFDDRTNLNPLHIWLIPSHIINHLVSASISISTISKWDEYMLNTNDVIEQCNILKGEQ